MQPPPPGVLLSLLPALVHSLVPSGRYQEDVLPDCVTWRKIPITPSINLSLPLFLPFFPFLPPFLPSSLSSIQWVPTCASYFMYGLSLQTRSLLRMADQVTEDNYFNHYPWPKACLRYIPGEAHLCLSLGRLTPKRGEVQRLHSREEQS